MDKNIKELLELSEVTLDKCSRVLCSSFTADDYAIGCGKLADGVAALINSELHKNDPKPA